MRNKMDPQKVILGKKVLIVDDEKDILDVLTELLQLCKLDTASSFEEAKDFLDRYDYDIVVLDIMGVNGFDLLEIAKQKGIPALMLTAHALTEESLKRSAQDGASYFVPKDEIAQIATFVADVLEATEKKKNPWVRWFERLSGTFDAIFTGPNWREREKEFWDKMRWE
jgi:DNA-binding NtrC family response regulator